MQADEQQSGCDHTLHHVDGDQHLKGSWTEQLSVQGGRLKVFCGACDKFYGYLSCKQSKARQHFLERCAREKTQTGSSSLVQGVVQCQPGQKTSTEPTGRRRPIDFKAVKQMVPIADVLQLIGYTPRKRTGNQLRGPCPVHKSRSETSTVFSVNLGRNIFKCFSCGSEGDQIKLYAEVTGLDVYDAAKAITEATGNPIPYKFR